MPLVQIYIATYNRPTLVVKAIQSALNQNFDSYEVIVSDNSTNDETEILISQMKDNRLSYIRRKPSLPAIDHLNVILKDVTADYFMIFHDDDVMYSDMISTLYNKIDINPSAIAIGSNAKFVINGVVRKKNYYSKLKVDKIITDRDELVKRYLLYQMVPFPSYLYRYSVTKRQYFNIADGGKYCDSTFIINLLFLGSIIFCAKPLMDYYIHTGQDSNTNEFSQKNKLINYYIRTSHYSSRHPLILRFRIQNIFVELINLIKNDNFLLNSKRNRNIIMLIFKLSTFEYFPRIMYAILVKKVRSI